jgi:hypothetical protein
MTNPYEWNAEPLPLSPDRAREIMAAGHDGWHTGCDGRKPWRYYLTPTEGLAVSRYWQNEAPGCASFNDVIRRCAK